MYRCNLPFLAAAAFVTLGGATGGCSPPPKDPDPADGATASFELPAVGASHRRTLKTGGEHHYLRDLESDTYIRVRVDQLDVDLVLSWIDPQGRQRLVVDSPEGATGPEEIEALAQGSGEYRLEIRPYESAAGGKYRLTVLALRRAQPQDRIRARAAGLYRDAETRRRAGGVGALEPSLLELYERAEAGWQQVGDLAFQALALRRRGQVHFARGEVQSAVDRFEESLLLARSLEDHQLTARLLNDRGVAARRAGSPELALASYEEAQALAHRIGDGREETAALNNLGAFYKGILELDRALDTFDRALRGWRRLEDRAGEAGTLHNLGATYTLLDRQQEALDALHRAWELAPVDSRQRAGILMSIGWAQFWAGQIDRALDTYREALALQRHLGDLRGEAVTQDRIGIALGRLGRWQEALEYHRRALAFFEKGEDILAQAHISNNRAEALAAQGRGESALNLHRQALELFRRLGERSGEAYTLYSIARRQRSAGQPAKGLATLEHALDLMEESRGLSRSPRIRSDYLASVQDAYAFHLDLLLEMHRAEPSKGYQRRLLQAGEGRRGRRLLDTLEETGADLTRGVDPTLLAREENLRRHIRLIEDGRRHWPTANGEEPPERAELRRQLSEHALVTARIRAASPAYAALVRATPITAEEVQHLLDEHTILLTYILGQEKSVLLRVDRNTIRAFPLPPRRELEMAARRLHSLLATSRRRGARQPARLAARAAAEMLLGPVAEELGQGRLVVVADGALGYLPFGALPDPRDRGSDAPLLAHHEIVSLPSASVLAALRRRPRERTAKGVAVVADPVFHRQDPRLRVDSTRAEPTADPGRPLRRLPATRLEAEGIRAVAPPGRFLSLQGFAASRSAILDGRLQGYRYLHFATHALVDTEYPELSGIVLSQLDETGRRVDGFLRLQDLYTLDLPAQLVVLSGCRTALGREVPGEGLLGLTYGFFHAGARAVIVSLWPVEDRAAAELMGRFYRHLLQEGLPPAAALRRAQSSMAEEPRWSPADWAAFVYQGDWDSAATESGT